MNEEEEIRTATRYPLIYYATKKECQTSSLRSATMDRRKFKKGRFEITYKDGNVITRILSST